MPDTLEPALEAALVKPEWRCFHCDEVFTDEQLAREHFGLDEAHLPACIIKAGAEGSLVRALRKAEQAADEATHRMHDESTEGWKAYYAAASRHGPALQAAEEAGYERGLADGRASPPPVAEGMVPAEPTRPGFIDWLWAQYRSVGVTPALRAAYDQYLAAAAPNQADGAGE